MKFIKIIRGRGAWGVGRASVPCTRSVIFDSRGGIDFFNSATPNQRKLTPSASNCLASSSRPAVCELGTVALPLGRACLGVAVW